MSFYDIDARQAARDNMDEQCESLQTRMSRLQYQIHYEQYYVDLYENSLNFLVMTEEGVKQGLYTNEEIVELANVFWEALPDVAAIRRKPFFALCDIAAHTFY